LAAGSLRQNVDVVPEEIVRVVLRLDLPQARQIGSIDQVNDGAANAMDSAIDDIGDLSANDDRPYHSGMNRAVVRKRSSVLEYE
jgi:hypothetical protein